MRSSKSPFHQNLLAEILFSTSTFLHGHYRTLFTHFDPLQEEEEQKIVPSLASKTTTSSRTSDPQDPHYNPHFVFALAAFLLAFADGIVGFHLFENAEAEAADDESSCYADLLRNFTYHRYVFLHQMVPPPVW